MTGVLELDELLLEEAAFEVVAWERGAAHEPVDLRSAAQLALGWLAILWPGRTFLRGAWAAIRSGTGHLDVPIAIALVSERVRDVHRLLGPALLMPLYRALMRWVKIRALVYELLRVRYEDGFLPDSAWRNAPRF